MYKIIWLIISGLFLAVAIWATRYDPAPLPGRVAQKLAQNHVVLYYESDSPDSQKQLADFGPFAEQLEKVDCFKETAKCQKEQIVDLPSFVFKDLGVEVTGYQTTQDLINLLKQMKIW